MRTRWSAFLSSIRRIQIHMALKYLVISSLRSCMGCFYIFVGLYFCQRKRASSSRLFSYGLNMINRLIRQFRYGFFGFEKVQLSPPPDGSFVRRFLIQFGLGSLESLRTTNFKTENFFPLNFEIVDPSMMVLMSSVSYDPSL